MTKALYRIVPHTPFGCNCVWFKVQRKTWKLWHTVVDCYSLADAKLIIEQCMECNEIYNAQEEKK